MAERESNGLAGDGPASGVPAWWPYAGELPNWHVWRGISGLVYGRRLYTSPPLVVRGEDAVDLRDAIRREEFLRFCPEPGDSGSDGAGVAAG
jgi:hypothetical protein